MTFLRNRRDQTLQLASSVEVLQSLLDALAHALLTVTYPHARVEELLVRLVSALGVADLGHEVVLLVEDVVTDTAQVGPLHVGVEVDLDDTVADGLLVLFLGGAGAAVEDEEDGLVLLRAGLLLHVFLVLLEEFGVQADVAGLVDSVNVTEASGNREVRADAGKGIVDGEDVLGLSVQRVVVDALVVDAVFLTTGDTDFLRELASCQFIPRHGKLTISSHCFIGAARLRYLAVVSMLNSTGSSERSIMWLEKRGSP